MKSAGWLLVAAIALAPLWQVSFAGQARAESPQAAQAPATRESVDPPAVRTWTERSSAKTAQATLLDVRRNRAYLRLASGEPADVSLDRLSTNDLQYIDDFLAARRNRLYRAVETMGTGTGLPHGPAPAASSTGTPLLAQWIDALDVSSLGAMANEFRAATPSAATSEPTFRTWTDSSGGKSARAALTDVRGNTAYLRTPSGKEVTTSLGGLSARDRQYVAEFRASRHHDSNGATANAAGTANQRPSSAPGSPNNELLAQGADALGLPYLGVIANGLRRLPLASVAGLLAGETDSRMPADLVYVRISREFLQEYVNRAVEHDDYVSDSILGTNISGQAHTSGSIELMLQPARDAAVANIIFSGTIWSNTQGSNGPVVLHNTAQTGFQAWKQVVLTPSGVQIAPAVSSAYTNSATNGIDSSLPGLRGNLAQRIAWRRVASMRPQADAIAADHAAARISQAFDAQMDTAIAALRRTLTSQLPRIRSAAGETPPAVRLSSTPNYVQIVLHRANASREEQQMFPPALQDSPAVSVRVHRSVLGQSGTALALRQSFAPLLAKLSGQSSGARGGGLVKQVTSDRNFTITWSPDRNWITLEYKPRPSRSQPAVLYGTAPGPPYFGPGYGIVY
jgi:hypothetical protein